MHGKYEICCEKKTFWRTYHVLHMIMGVRDNGVCNNSWIRRKKTQGMSIALFAKNTEQMRSIGGKYQEVRAVCRWRPLLQVKVKWKVDEQRRWWRLELCIVNIMRKGRGRWAQIITKASSDEDYNDQKHISFPSSPGGLASLQRQQA